MSDREFSVYRVTCDENGKSYIGITCRPVSFRWSAHVSVALKGLGKKLALHSAIKKYGREAFTVETLALACNGMEAAAIERGLIAQYGTMYPTGYNLTSGGELTKQPSPETRKRMSDAAKARGTAYLRTAAIRAKISASRKSIMTPEMRANIGSFHKGKIMSPETRAKISATKKGKSPKTYPANRRSRISVPMPQIPNLET